MHPSRTMSLTSTPQQLRVFAIRGVRSYGYPPGLARAGSDQHEFDNRCEFETNQQNHRNQSLHLEMHLSPRVSDAPVCFVRHRKGCVEDRDGGGGAAYGSTVT